MAAQKRCDIRKSRDVFSYLLWIFIIVFQLKPFSFSLQGCKASYKILKTRIVQLSPSLGFEQVA